MTSADGPEGRGSEEPALEVPADLVGLPGDVYQDRLLGRTVCEELRQAAARAQDRATELRARTAVVLADSNRVLERAALGEMAYGCLQELIDTNIGLRGAIETRAVIEQAKGITMAATGCGAEDAFGLLAERAQARQRTVAEVAADLVRRTVQPPPR
jgi:hypothetical protein